VRPPFFCVGFVLDFQLIGHSFTLELPIIFVHSRMNDLLLLVDCGHTNMLLVVQVIFIGHISLINQLLVIFSFVALFVRLGFIPGLKIGY